MPANLEQSAANTTAKYQTRTCAATFTTPTKPGSLIVVVCIAAGTIPSRLQGPAGFTLIAERGLRDIQMAVWYRQASASTTSVSVTALDAEKSLQVRAMEYSGVAQSNALDKVVLAQDESLFTNTGNTGNTSQADELVLAFIGNQYASTAQFGFGGGMVRLYETVSPQFWARGSNEDWERSRITVHQATPSSVGNFGLFGLLSTYRRWLSILVTFRGGTTGPARMTSKTTALTFTGKGPLTVFGPLQGKDPLNPGRCVLTVGTPKQARIGPYDYQYRLGGWNGLLIGNDTPYYVESHEGLEGWEIRTSDDDLPRGDGALRGVDLQSSRQILFKLKVAGDRHDVETAMDTLYRNLAPQRDQDWELIWRHPNRPLRMVRVRPTTLIRGLDYAQTVVNDQSFALIAADPRHYSAFLRQAKVVTSTAGQSPLTPTSIINAGNGFAYPLIRIDGPTSGPPVTRVELINTTYDVSFVVESVLPFGSTLVGDMEARATGAPRSVVTVDSQSKYGAWQHPRQTFTLGPGVNALTIETVPAGAPVKVSLEYRDTWSG